MKIEVLHICSYYYGTKLYQNLMNNQQKQGLSFKVYAPCDYHYHYEGKEEYLIKAPCYHKMDRIFFYYKYKKVYKDILERVDVKNYHILHAHSLFANGYIAYLLHKQYQIPYVVAVRNTDINVFFKYCIYLRKLGVAILENASKIVLISNAYQNKIMKYIPEEKRNAIIHKCVVIPNGIDQYFLENVGKPKKRNEETLNLVFTGRIDNNKNLITTIKCCKHMLKNKIPVKLTVIGTIASQKYYKLIKKYDFINYVGQKNKEEIREIYKNMDIFVMPSKHETFGLVYVEAMSQGLPVIYTRNEGFDQFFGEGEVGYSVKYNDDIEMTEKIKMIMNDYENMTKRCIEKSQIFNWKDIATEYMSIYTQIYKKR